jgi:hypothetical protein
MLNNYMIWIKKLFTFYPGCSYAKGGFNIRTVLSFVFIPLFGHAKNNNISVGYGFGAFNSSKGIGKLRGTNGNYDFLQLAYSREKSLSSRISLLLEPFLAYVNRPTDGLDLGMIVGLKFYLNKDTKKGLFGTLATGASYTTVGFREQGTHMLFMLQGGE